MAVRRIVIGRRANGDNGIFISPAGIDALTAADDQLLLNITSKVSQLISLGAVASSQFVPFALSRAPYVILTNRMTMSGVAGYGSLDGPVRPAPNGVYGTNPASAYADIATDGSGMSVSVPSGNRVAWAAYNVPFS